MIEAADRDTGVRIQAKIIHNTRLRKATAQKSPSGYCLSSSVHQYMIYADPKKKQVLVSFPL